MDRQFVIIVDSREKDPLDFSPFADCGDCKISVERATLNCGDYSLRGWEHHLMIERKSLQDCVSTLTHGRDRFMREVYDRGSVVPCKHIVVEASWRELSSPYTFARGANPLSIVNTLYSLMMPPVNAHVFAARNRMLCAWYVVNVCVNFHRRMTKGSKGVWRSLFDPNAADLPPIPCPYESIF